jgi:nucleoside-diphosphate-sugar epimerase
MRALVTGAAGFIGSALARRLVADGTEVVGIDAFTDYYDVRQKRDNIASIPVGGFELIEADVSALDLESVVGSVDLVFHLAGQPGVRASWGSEFEVCIDRNVVSTHHLLEASRSGTRLRRFVFASSSSVYGDAARYPTPETDTPAPISPYGVTKLAAEHLAVLYAKNFGLPTTSLRYFTVYGPGQRPDMAFTRFCRTAITGETVRVFGTGEQLRDFTFVDDVVEASILAATVEHEPGSVFNVAGGSSTSVNEVLRLLSGFTNAALDIVHSPKSTGDVMRTSGDTTRIRDSLGWTPTVSLEEGLRREFDWAADTRHVWDAAVADWA